MSGKHGGLTSADTDHPVYAALNEFFHHYLVKRDLQGTLELLSNQLYSVGTGEDEVAIGKAAFLSLLQAESPNFRILFPTQCRTTSKRNGLPAVGTVSAT